MNSLFQQLSKGQSQPQQQTPQNNPNTIEQLYSFAQNFKGDPKQQVMDLLKYKGISQQEYNDAINQTNMLYKTIFGR